MGNTTALQELFLALHNTHPEQWNELIMHDKERLLAIEKTVIIDAYNQGYRDGETNVDDNTTDVSKFDDANNYFITTFNNQ